MGQQETGTNMTLTPDRTTPLWAPPQHTVVPVEAGIHWDAVAVGQELGLAALAVLDQETRSQPGPVIWDTRVNRFYFLVPAGSLSAVDPRLSGRLLGRGTWIAVPGLDLVDPIGVCWPAPPNPSAPEQLVDPLRLAAALHHANTSQWVTRNVGDRAQEILASADQLAGRACIICRTSVGPLYSAGSVTVPGDGVEYVREVVSCTEHQGVHRG
ncbi:hypothetical protein [Kitasatospora sp. CB01950]|uniref:hypothetical protein n=1 Tax=Kitasatospora sp. CB01950 TaxID=1703930 RepID=UPI00093F676A|nr:hypothetical protein [Kitasatospora sp. CB01950]